MFKDPPRRILDLLSIVLLILFIALLYFGERLPDRIFGINKVFCFTFLFVGAVAARWGGRLLDWLRRWDMGGIRMFFPIK